MRQFLLLRVSPDGVEWYSAHETLEDAQENMRERVDAGHMPEEYGFVILPVADMLFNAGGVVAA